MKSAQRIKDLLDGNLPLSLKDCKRGIEKESLRTSCGKISSSIHPMKLGSPLFNKYITTDFSESLLEAITPPLKSNTQTISFLKSIEKRVYQSIEDELLWPFSIPPSGTTNDLIKIAYYGTSNQAKLKQIYRKGLSHRYGRIMQVIAGIHYNFSFPNSFFSEISRISNQKKLKEVRDDIYLATIRNLKRNNWLLLYLFGSSPIVTEELIGSRAHNFRKYRDIFYLPHATSLRMSDLGYTNKSQSGLRVSTNSLDDYISSLDYAVSNPSEEYSQIDTFLGDSRLQLSENYLQIEDEFYSSVRPKSSAEGDKRQTKKLKKTGIDYIEIRSLDLDPDLPSGISMKESIFLDLFIIYCMASKDMKIGNDEYHQIQKNDLNVSLFGRKKRIKLKRNLEEIYLKDWGLKILDGMESIAEAMNMDIDIMPYRRMVLSPEETKSGLILDDILSSKIDFTKHALSIAQKNKAILLDEIVDPRFEKLINKEIEQSFKLYQENEKENDITFENYLKEYLS